VLLTCLTVALVRCVYLWQPLRSDEGGYLLAAREWRRGGEFLYGDYHVDRPPGLMLLFRVAASVEDDRAIRMLAIPFALLLVVASARAAALVAGPRAATWAAVVAGAFAVSPAVAADQADGELFAAPLVAASIALSLDAWRRERRSARMLLAAGAGLLATAATLVKQNFLEGFVFVVVLVAAEALRHRRVTRRVGEVLAGVAVGAAIPHLAVLGWAAAAGAGGTEVWTELAAFRQQAFAVIWDGHVEAPLRRAAVLCLLAVVSGLAGLVWAWFARGRDATPESRAVTGCLVFGLVAVAAGGSYWPHYLLQLAPAVALATGIGAVRVGDRGRATRRWSAVAAASALVGAIGSAVVYATVPAPWFQQRTGEWLAASSRPGDSAVVAYGNPAILEAADLPSPYPYLWSLPMRTLDPDQSRLRAVLAGPDAPTWFVVVTPLDSWDIDDDGRLAALLEREYDVAAVVCGRPVHLRQDLTREAAPPPTTC
jgi:4-amino-4-deoxy-L-arabinose transferase-like glycosyltransferase